MDAERKRLREEKRQALLAEVRNRTRRKEVVLSALESILTSDNLSDIQRLEVARLIVELDK